MSENASPAPSAGVLCVGLAVLDQVFQVDTLPREARKHFAQAFSTSIGGPAAVASLAIAALGGRATLWARLGADGAGEEIRSGLAAAGVDTSDLEGLRAGRSGTSAVMVDAAGERMIVNYSEGPSPALLDRLPLARVGQYAAVMADLRWPAAAEAALKAAQEAGLPGVLDADTVPTPVPEGPFAAASHILFSSDGLSLYDGERSRRESALVRAGQETGAWVGVSAGGEGAYWVDNDGLHHRPAFRVQAVNTLGAGDVMHGAFTLALAEGQDAAEALTFASAAAGAKIARADGGLPTREDVRGLIQAR